MGGCATRSKYDSFAVDLTEKQDRKVDDNALAGFVKVADCAPMEESGVAFHAVQLSSLNVGERGLCLNGRAVTINMLRVEERRRYLEWWGMIRELRTELVHPCLCSIVDAFECNGSLVSVFDRCHGGEMFEYVVAQRCLQDPVAKPLAYDVLCGLAFMHRRGFVHRNVKAEAIFLDDRRCRAKLGRFEFTTKLVEGTGLTERVGTLGYTAPEVLSLAPEGYGTLVDLWSCGVLLFVMLAGYAPFQADSPEATQAQIQQCQYEFDPQYWAHVPLEAQHLIRDLLVVNAANRLTAEAALDMPWFQDAMLEDRHTQRELDRLLHQHLGPDDTNLDGEPEVDLNEVLDLNTRSWGVGPHVEYHDAQPPQISQLPEAPQQRRP